MSEIPWELWPARVPSEYDRIHHAMKQGARSESRYVQALTANPYGDRLYRAAWYTGFFTARVCRERVEADAARIAELLATIHRQNEVIKTMGEKYDELKRQSK